MTPLLSLPLLYVFFSGTFWGAWLVGWAATYVLLGLACLIFVGHVGGLRVAGLKTYTTANGAVCLQTSKETLWTGSRFCARAVGGDGGASGRKGRSRNGAGRAKIHTVSWWCRFWTRSHPAVVITHKMTVGCGQIDRQLQVAPIQVPQGIKALDSLCCMLRCCKVWHQLHPARRALALLEASQLAMGAWRRDLMTWCGARSNISTSTCLRPRHTL